MAMIYRQHRLYDTTSGSGHIVPSLHSLVADRFYAAAGRFHCSYDTRPRVCQAACVVGSGAGSLSTSGSTWASGAGTTVKPVAPRPLPSQRSNFTKVEV